MKHTGRSVHTFWQEKVVNIEETLEQGCKHSPEDSNTPVDTKHVLHHAGIGLQTVTSKIRCADDVNIIGSW